MPGEVTGPPASTSRPGHAGHLLQPALERALGVGGVGRRLAAALAGTVVARVPVGAAADLELEAPPTSPAPPAERVVDPAQHRALAHGQRAVVVEDDEDVGAGPGGPRPGGRRVGRSSGRRRRGVGGASGCWSAAATTSVPARSLVPPPSSAAADGDDRDRGRRGGADASGGDGVRRGGLGEQLRRARGAARDRRRCCARAGPRCRCPYPDDGTRATTALSSRPRRSTGRE